RSGAGFVAGAAVVAAAYWLGIHSGSSDVELIAVPVPVPVTAPVAPPAPSTDGRGGQDGQDAVQPAATSPGPSVGPSVGSASSPAGRLSPGGAVPTKSAPPTIATPAPAQVAATQTEGTADAGPAAAAPTGSVRAAPPSSELAIELQVFEPARDSLVDGDFAAAKTGFERYLAQLPHGRMVGEAQIGRLQASKGLNDPAATASLAEKLQDLPELAGRRQEILRLRAESLVLLDRCDEALLVASDLSTRDASEIRRACRATRRE
ncbi:MAG: hypothetical protein ABMB14_31025, partial [Myxococcota bacterium]